MIEATEIVCGLWLCNLHAITDETVQKRSTMFISVCQAPVEKYSIFIRDIRNRLVIVDSVSAQFDKIIHTIDRELRRGGIITVFCETTQQRSPSIVIAYLMKYAGLPFEKAMRCLISKNARVFPDDHKCIYANLMKEFEKTVDTTTTAYF